MALYLILEPIFKVHPVIKLDIQQHPFVVQVADAKRQDFRMFCKSGEEFVLCVGGPGVFVERLFIDYVEIVGAGFCFDGNLKPTILLDCFVEALDLIEGEVIVKANGQSAEDTHIY